MGSNNSGNHSGNQNLFVHDSSEYTLTLGVEDFAKDIAIGEQD